MDLELTQLLTMAGAAILIGVAERQRVLRWVRRARGVLAQLPPPVNAPVDAREGAPVAALGLGELVGPRGLTPRCWLTLLNEQPDQIPHVLIIGATGAGKTTFTRALLAARPGQIAVLTPKPDPADWPEGAPVVTIGDAGDFVDLSRAFESLGAVVRGRLVAAKRRQPGGEPLTIVCDDWPVLASECGRPASDLFKLVGRLGRSLRVRLVVLSQSERVKSLGLEGEGDAVENFARVVLARGHRATLWADGHELPLDTSGVPDLAARPVDLGRWWALPGAGALPGAAGRSDALEALEALPGSGPNLPVGHAGSVEAIEVTAGERAQILAAAQVEPSRRRVCLRVFGATGGRAYAKVQAVCDAAGLLGGDGLDLFRRALDGR